MLAPDVHMHLCTRSGPSRRNGATTTAALTICAWRRADDRARAVVEDAGRSSAQETIRVRCASVSRSGDADRHEGASQFDGFRAARTLLRVGRRHYGTYSGWIGNVYRAFGSLAMIVPSLTANIGDAFALTCAQPLAGQ